MSLSIPIIFEIETILYVWLGQVPEHTVLFTRLVLILSLSDIISNTLITAQLATGKIRNYQIVVGGTQMMNFPISYILLRMGVFPEITIIVAIFISQICLLERLLFLRKMVHLPSLRYFKEVYLNLIVVTILSVAVPGIMYFSIENEALRFFAVCISSVITSAAVTYAIGLQRNERVLVVHRIKKWFRK
jgi:hypothetical protein